MRRFDPDTVQNGYKKGGINHTLGLIRHFLSVRLRILVMDDMSLDV